MSAVPAKLPSTATAEAPAVLLPYQKNWIADTAQVKVCEKSRRTGLTWAEAADDVLIAAAEKPAGGQNVWYIGYNLEMAREYIDACGMWAKAFDRAASEFEEGILEGQDRDIKTYIIRFPNSGHRITALSSRPSNLRGKQGVIVLDEAAITGDLPGLLKAAMALLIWGGKVRIISTHFGTDNPFNEVVTQIRTGKKPYSLHRLDFDQAVEQGLYRRVCLRLNTEWTPEAEAQWTQGVYAFYGDDSDEELRVIPSSGSGTFLSTVLIESCMYQAPVLRWECADGFAQRSDEARKSECQAWIDDHLAPLIEALKPELEHGFGMDFGRSGDLSAIAPYELGKDLVRRVPFVLELRNVPFKQQEQILFWLVDRLPRFMAGAMDARGNGQYLAESAMQRFGAARIEQIMLTIEWYRDAMPRFKAAFEDQTMLVPLDADVRADLRSIKMDKGIAKIPDTLRQQGTDGKQRHGDTAVALVLAHYASLKDVAPIEFTRVPPKSERWDGPGSASSEDEPFPAGRGAW